MAVSDAEIDAAIERGKRAVPSRVINAAFDESIDSIVLRFDTGVRVELPRGLLEGLGDATPSQLKAIKILGPGTGLEWPKLGVTHYVPGLLDGIFGTRQWMHNLTALRARMSTLGRMSAAVRTPAKAAAARENGKKGGRPKKSYGEAGLDGRHRDVSASVRAKNGDTVISTLRKVYGDNFAPGYRGDMKLSTLLSRTGAETLKQLVKQKK